MFKTRSIHPKRVKIGLHRKFTANSRHQCLWGKTRVPSRCSLEPTSGYMHIDCYPHVCWYINISKQANSHFLRILHPSNGKFPMKWWNHRGNHPLPPRKSSGRGANLPWATRDSSVASLRICSSGAIPWQHREGKSLDWGKIYIPIIGAIWTSSYHWIGLRENLYTKPWFLPLNMGFPVIFTLNQSNETKTRLPEVDQVATTNLGSWITYDSWNISYKICATELWTRKIATALADH